MLRLDLDTALWIAGILMEAAVVGLLLYRRMWRLLPVFCVYSVWTLLSDAGAYTVMHFFPGAYFATYLGDTVVDSVLQLGVLVELAWSVLRPFRASLPRGALVVVGVVVIVLGAVIWPLAGVGELVRFPVELHLLVRLQQTVSILRILFFLVLAGCSQLLSIGFGAWAIGGGNWQFGWGSQDDAESIAAIHRALDLGVNWIDTAAIYGLGHSEEVVARALKSAAHKPYVFTKCSMRWHADRSIYRSLRPASLAEELEASLRRLGVDTIDLYQVHWPDPESEIEEGWEALERFREQGKVRWIGVSNFSVAQMKRAQKIAPLTSLQPPYSMLRPAVEDEILPFAHQHGIGVINYSPMVSGLLTGTMTAERVAAFPSDDWRRNAVEFKQPRLDRNLRLVELLREIGVSHGVGPGVVAVAWTLHNPAITAAIVGGRSAAQVEGLAPALHFRLTDEEYDHINAFLASTPA